MVFNNVSTPIGRSFIDVKFSRNKHYGQVRQMSRSLSSISLGNRPMERFFEEQSADDFTDIFIHDITEQVPPKPFKCVPVIHVLWSLGLLLLYCIFINSRIRAYFNSPSNLAIPLNSGALRWRPAAFNECDYNCHIEACQIGCKDLESLESTCDERCSSSKGPESCFQGCYAVSDIFLHQIQYLLNHVTVESKLDNIQGIFVSWTFGNNFSLVLQEISAAEIKWISQSRTNLNILRQGTGWKWTEFPQGSFKDSASEVTISIPLEESPEIEVRLAAMWRKKIIVSRSFFQTINGISFKSKKPDLVSKIQISSTSFLVCWQSDPVGHLSRDIVRYKVELWMEEKVEKEFKTESQCHVFRNLEKKDDLIYSLKIYEIPPEENSEVNEEDKLKVELKMKDMEESESDEKDLIFTDGMKIYKLPDPKDFFLLGDLTVIPFKVTINQEISSIATVSECKIFVGLTDGSIFSLSIIPPNSEEKVILEMMTDNSTIIEELNSEQSLIREPDGTGIIQIGVDFVQEKIYAVRNQSGLIRCSFKDCSNATVLKTNSINYIERIAVDSWNGFLYYSTKDGDVFVATLFPSEAFSSYSFTIQRRVAQIPQIFTMEIDYRTLSLISTLKNGSLISMDLVDNSIKNLRENLAESEKYNFVQKSVFFKGNFFWTSSDCSDEHEWKTCLYGEEQDPESGIIHLNRYLFPGKVVDLGILDSSPRPSYLMPPEEVGLVVSGKESRATWEPPLSLPFQAPGTSWRDLKYIYKLIEDSSGTVLETSETRDLGVFLRPSLGPSANYSLLVQACIDQEDEDIHTCSRPSKTFLTTPENSPTSILIYTDPPEGEHLSTFDILGKQVFDEVYFPKLSINPPEVVGFDNSTKSIYTATRNDISIFRVYPTRVKYRFLDFLTVTHLTILPTKALVVFSSAYQIVQYRLTATFDRIIYQCASVPCGEVVGLTSDDLTSTVYYLIQSENGTISLFEFNVDQLNSKLISSTSTFPVIKELKYSFGIFIFISIDGRVGIFEKNLEKINYNYGIVHPRLILVSMDSADESVFFSTNLGTGTPNSGILEWKMNKQIEEGKIIYKIQLFKERLGGERTVDLTLNSSYYISPKVLETWPSQQKFDAIIEAITPWTVISMNATELIAPTKPPTAPRHLRIFVTQQKTVDGARAIIDVFWDGPEEWNGEMLGYVVNCSVTDGTSVPNIFIKEVSGKESPTYSFSVKSGKVSCAVAATNEKNLIGKYSDLVTVDSSDVRPLVRLFAIDSISNLIPISNWSTIWDGVRIRRESTIALEGRERGLNLSIVQNNIELQPNMSSENQETDSNSSIFSNDVRVRTRRQSTTSPKYQGMAFVDNKLYAIRKEDSVQPFAVMLDVNNANTVLHKVQLNLEFHEVDAVTSDWVANRLLFVAGHDIFQLVLDTFESLTVATPQKLFGLSSGAQDAKQLIFDPFANVAYLLTKNGSLFKIDIVHGTEENLGISLDCLKSQTVISLVADFKWNRASSPTIYALTWNGLISFKPTSEECSEVDIKWDKFGEKGIKSVLSIALADEIFVFGTASDLIIYDKNTASPISIPIQNSPMKQILALSQSSQPYPERSCFQLPNPETIQFNVTNEGRSGALVTVVTPVPPTACQNVSFPPTQYEVYFKRKKTDKVKHFRSISNQIHIENGILDKETDYDVYLSWLNRYYTYKDLLSEVKSFRTGYGFPTAPKDSSAFSLTPDTVLLYWKLPSSLNAPKEEIKYRISQQSSSLAAPVSIGAKQFENGTFSNIFSDIVSCVLDPCQAQIANLRPASDYKFWVTAVHIKSLIPTFGEDLEAVSPEAPTRTIDIPGILRLENETSDSLILRWNFLDPVTVPQIINIQYRLSGGETAWTSSNTTFDPRGIPVVNVTISPLRSSTAYDFRFVATYSGKYTYDGVEKNFIEQFYQPIQQARTKPGTPSAPTNVEITKEKAFWILKWSNPENDGGAPIISFAVEYRPNKTSEWEIAERGIPSEKLWWKLDKPSAYTPESQFRVRAANSEGFGPYGFTQEIEVKEETGNKLYYYALWIGMIFIFAFLAFCSAVIFFVHKNNKKEKMRKFKVNKSIKLDELNLQSAEIPKPFQNDLKNLPHVSRDCVKVSEKIGRGSFGEVYRGDAWNLPLIGTKRVPVAIKTLKEGYSNEDKIKFIKEAILMNNFDHPNIVKLLGVCFEAEPHLIILELMEGGDLQNFLRSCRPHDSAPSQLSLNELFSVIIDVGRGCAYLEMHKHVHRDLAARNCLITSKSSSNRVTKIADFGLARQMYLNEYYRVRGEDFLPLRWLAVESSLDGVFTTKTDVWAYGVLCWEAFTLGEQPYRELMNSMILPFLRSGNRLEKPNECPDEVFEIISSCWDSNPDKRPSFSELVRQLEALHNRPDMRSNSPFPLHQNGYINSGFDASQDSSIGQLDHHHRRQQSAETHRFDKTESSKKNSGLPGHLRQRVGNSFSGERPESSFSGQTEITICDDLGDDYEVPRGHPPNSSLSSSSGFQSGQRSVSPSDSKRKAKVSRV